MIPKAGDAVRMLAQRILSNVLPDLKSTYVLSDAALVGMLLTNLANEMESGIARRLEDIESMKSVLSDARDVNRGLDIDSLLELTPDSMQLDDVNTVHDQLSAALVQLHKLVDSHAGHREIDEAIWSYLEQHAERHKLDA